MDIHEFLVVFKLVLHTTYLRFLQISQFLSGFRMWITSEPWNISSDFIYSYIYMYALFQSRNNCCCWPTNWGEKFPFLSVLKSYKLWIILYIYLMLRSTRTVIRSTLYYALSTLFKLMKILISNTSHNMIHDK